MKIEIDRQEFLKTWQLAEKFASTRTTREALGGILITASEDGTVTFKATDLKSAVKCFAQGVSVKDPGSALAQSAILGSMIRKSSVDKIILEFKEGRGLLTAGDSKMRMPVIPVDNFPNFAESTDGEAICEILASDLSTLISEGSCASSQPQDFPKYMGTCLLRTEPPYFKAISTDGKRLSLSKIMCSILKTEPEDLLLPSPALKDLGKTISSYDDAVVTILANSSNVWFQVDNIDFSIRRIESNFPNYERILNSEVRTTLRTSCNDLSSALDRIDIIAKANPAHIMAMALQTNGEVRITSRAPDVGTATETFLTNVEGRYMQLGFNVSYFQDGLKALGPGEIVIEFSGEEEQTRMYRKDSDEFLYMLMPARLSPQDSMTEAEINDFRDMQENIRTDNLNEENNSDENSSDEENSGENNY